jgi:hypothetical protein
MNQRSPHAELIGTFHRAQVDAAHKQALVKSAAAKGPKAIQAAVDAAGKAARRRDACTAKLIALGVVLTD